MIPIFLLRYWITPEVWRRYCKGGAASITLFKWCAKHRWVLDGGAHLIIYDAEEGTGQRMVLNPEVETFFEGSQVFLPSLWETQNVYLRAKADLKAQSVTANTKRWDRVSGSWLRLMSSTAYRSAQREGTGMSFVLSGDGSLL